MHPCSVSKVFGCKQEAVPVAVAVAALMVAVSACGRDEAAPEESTVLDVAAASVLREAFADIAANFEADHPDIEVRLAVAGSSELVTGVANGAPVDVLATADEATMATAREYVVGVPMPVASSTMVIAVPAGNPAGVTSVADLARPDVDVVICAPQVPCGAAAAEIRNRTGTAWSVRSEELAVAGVLAKVTSGEADAGVVYTTDVAASDGAASGVPIPAELNVTMRSTMAEVVNPQAVGDTSRAAREFMAAVLSPDGQQTLADYGFSPP